MHLHINLSQSRRLGDMKIHFKIPRLNMWNLILHIFEFAYFFLAYFLFIFLAIWNVAKKKETKNLKSASLASPGNIFIRLVNNSKFSSSSESSILLLQVPAIFAKLCKILGHLCADAKSYLKADRRWCTYAYTEWDTRIKPNHNWNVYNIVKNMRVWRLPIIQFSWTFRPILYARRRGVCGEYAQDYIVSAWPVTLHLCKINNNFLMSAGRPRNYLLQDKCMWCKSYNLQGT